MASCGNTEGKSQEGPHINAMVKGLTLSGSTVEFFRNQNPGLFSGLRKFYFFPGPILDVKYFSVIELSHLAAPQSLFKKTLLLELTKFQDFPGPPIVFKDFPVKENAGLKFMYLLRFSGPVQNLFTLADRKISIQLPTLIIHASLSYHTLVQKTNRVCFLSLVSRIFKAETKSTAFIVKDAFSFLACFALFPSN